MRRKIMSIAVVILLGIACIASVTGERMNSNEYGRMVAVNALYDEPVTQARYEKVSYEDMENIRYESDQLAKIEFEESREKNTLTSADQSEKADKNKAALQAILEADKNSKRQLAEERQEKYQLNEIKEVDTSTRAFATSGNATYILPQGNAAVAVPVAASPEQGTYIGQFVLTGYCPCAICCGKTNGITACGTLATANHTIAADSRFAFGTQMIINGILYTVEDRGGAIKGNRIDVFFTSHQEALNFGRQTADVFVVQ